MQLAKIAALAWLVTTFVTAYMLFAPHAPTSDDLEHVTIRRIDASHPSFNMRSVDWGNESEPVILSNLTRTWPSWNPDRVGSLCSGDLTDYRERVFGAVDGYNPATQAALSLYLRLRLGKSSEGWRRDYPTHIRDYIQYTRAPHPSWALEDLIDPRLSMLTRPTMYIDDIDASCPALFDELRASEEFRRLQMPASEAFGFIAADDHRSAPLHVHNHPPNRWWNMQVWGRKRWVLYPTHASDDLTPHATPGKFQVVHNYEFDPFSPDFARHPRARRAPAYVGDLEPGDILIFPTLWSHAVKALPSRHGERSSFSMTFSD